MSWQVVFRHSTPTAIIHVIDSDDAEWYDDRLAMPLNYLIISSKDVGGGDFVGIQRAVSMMLRTR